MYHDYTQDELRSYCRSCIETMEVWARRLIHEKMTETYGNDYLNATRDGGEPLVKKDIKKHVQNMVEKEPGRFNRPVDTLFIDHIIYFLCNPKWYKNLFKEAMDYAYPQGCDEAREYLSRLVPIRNPLSHSNPISMRQVEQAICYSHDFVEGLKQYYKDRGEDQMWNVPKIIKVKDSLGNVFESITEKMSIGASVTVPQYLRSGEKYSVEIEVDSSFKPDEYDIKWRMSGKNTADFNNSKRLTVDLNLSDVGETTIITCTVTQRKDWHRFGNHDSCVNVHLKVLPPVE